MASTSKPSIKQIIDSEKFKESLELHLIPSLPELCAKFVELFGKRSYYNEDFAVLAFHSIVGVALRHCRIRKGKDELDPRVNIIWIQQTGTGKSKAPKIIYDILHELGFNIISPMEFTDASMIGSIERVRIKKEEHIYRDVGILQSMDIIYFDDTITVFKEQNVDWQKRTKAYMRRALDTLGTNLIEKSMKGGIISFYPKSTIIVSTYHINSPETIIDDSGTAQRFLVIARNVDYDLRIKNTLEENKMYATSELQQIKFDAEYDKRFNEIVYKLRKLMPEKRNDELDLSGIVIDKIATKEDKNSFDKKKIKAEVKDVEKIYFTFDVDTREKRDVFAVQMAEYINTECSHNVKETMFTFYNRMLEYANKLALHSAILRRSKNNKISLIDVGYGQEVITKIFSMLIKWIEGHSRTDEDTPVTSRERPANIILNNFRTAFDLLVKEGKVTKDIEGYKYIPKTELYTAVQKFTKKSSVTVRQSFWPKVQKYFIERHIGTFTSGKFGRQSARLPIIPD